MYRFLACILPFLLLTNWAASAKAAKPQNQYRTANPVRPDSRHSASTLSIGYLTRDSASGAPDNRPFFEQANANEGVMGARLGVEDSNTTGQFTRQTFMLDEQTEGAEGDTTLALKSLIARGNRFILVNLPATEFSRLSELAEASQVMLLDIGSRADQLRGIGCRANSLHLLPSHAMLADSIAQYLGKKRWLRWFLVSGTTGEDRNYAEAIRRSAKKFGSKIIKDRVWQYSSADRRTPESEIPVFTQAEDYDVVIVIDETRTFGDALPYRTWLSRPVIGTSGLIPSAWNTPHESWGALQLQRRFHEKSGRWMTEKDYGAWLGVRAIAEGATRTQTQDFEKVKNFILSEEFSLAGFKGVPLSFRTWDHQLRQPILLATDKNIVTVAPVEGYLHPTNELDTLGIDRTETSCKF